MRENRFDDSLETLRRKPLPACPGNLEATVLQRIRLQKERDADIWFWLDSVLPKLSFAAPIFVAAILDIDRDDAALGIDLLEDHRPEGRATTPESLRLHDEIWMDLVDELYPVSRSRTVG